MLDIGSVDRIEDPVESQYRVENHCGVVIVMIFVTSHVSKPFLVCIGLKERPIHKQVPDGDIDCVQYCEGYEEC